MVCLSHFSFSNSQIQHIKVVCKCVNSWSSVTMLNIRIKCLCALFHFPSVLQLQKVWSFVNINILLGRQKWRRPHHPSYEDVQVNQSANQLYFNDISITLHNSWNKIPMLQDNSFFNFSHLFQCRSTIAKWKHVSILNKTCVTPHSPWWWLTLITVHYLGCKF